MCPACLAAAATTWLVAGSATVAGGLGALALPRIRRSKRDPDDFQLRMQPEPKELVKLEGEET
jgi:hypothetical protein